MRTSKEERADLRARCRAGVIAVTTDAALVAALVDDVEDLDALVDAGARAVSQMAQDAAAEVDRLTREVYVVTTALGAWMDGGNGDVPMRHTPAGAVLAVLAHVDRLTEARDEARAERDARPEITAEAAAAWVRAGGVKMPSQTDYDTATQVEAAIFAHAGKVAR